MPCSRFAAASLLVFSVACSTAAPPHRARPKADGAELYRLQILQDENGRIAADGLTRALRQMERMKAVQPTAAGVTQTSWAWLGPGNIGGRITTILFDPSNSGTIWVNNPGGGIWKSTNGGESWAPVNDFLANLAVSSLAMSPADSNLMLAGTGGGAGGSLLRGAGIFKSVDKGVTWTQVASTAAADWSRGVERIAFSPDGQTILAATKAAYSDVPATIFRSTDNGANWTETLNQPGLEASMVAFSPADGSKAIAAMKSGLAFYSDDGGRTWSQASGIPPEGLVTLSYAKSDPSIVYGGLDRNGGEIYKSTDGGRSYSLVNSGTTYLGDQGWYCNVVAVDPTNANLVLIAGLDIYRSSDGGTNFTKISQWSSAPKSAHADHGTIAFPPNYDGTSNKTVFFGNDGGIYKTPDITSVEGEAGWQPLNNNLGVTQVYGARANPTSGVVMAGTQDNGSIRYSGDAQGWTRWQGGDGGFIAADPSDPNTFYGEYVYLTIYRANDGGVARPEDIYGTYNYWNGDQWEKRQRANPITEARSGTANFIAPFILDPNDPNRMLAGARSLWVTDNVKKSNDEGGPDWRAIKAPAGEAQANNISAIAVAEGTPDVTWVGHNNGDVFVTTNALAAAPQWKKVDEGAPALPDRKVTRLAIDPRDRNTVYVTFGGFSANNIWKTTDGGTTWAPTVGSGAAQLPQVPVETLAIHPRNSAWLYAGTEVGLFTSEDGGATWTIPQDGPANVSVKELSWAGTTLYASTFGRGVYKAEIPGGAAKTAQSCFALTIDGAGPTGGVLADVQPNCANGTRYEAGTVVHLHARPRSPFGFASWSGDAHGQTRTATLTMNADKVVQAHFSTTAACYPLTIVVQPAGAGTVRLDSEESCGVGYPEGEEVSFFATPAAGYAFGGWYGDYFDTDPEGSIDMDGAKTIVAQFARPAANDDIANAVAIDTASFSFVEDTSSASNAPGDPDTCADGKGGKTVWFVYRAAQTGVLTVTTDGSNYHTLVQALTGSPMKRFACSDQSLSLANVIDYEDVVASDELAGLTLAVTAGQTYWIEIADATEPELEQDRDLQVDTDLKDTPDGGLLQVQARFVAGAVRHRSAKH